MVLAAGCDGAIGSRSGSPTTLPEPPTPLVASCESRGQGVSAKMRLLWRDAYLAELSQHLGPDAAALAVNVGLSPATTKAFGFESAGAQLTDFTLESLANSADAIAEWSLSSDAVAQQVYGCQARTVQGLEAEVCFEAFMLGRGARLLRRPVSLTELGESLAFFRAEAALGQSDGTREGFRQGLASLLVHPDFLYLYDAPVGDTSALNLFSLASKVSFALTGHGPDELLFASAEDGSLGRPEVLAAHVERMLRGLKARDALVRFFRQWLGYETGSYTYTAGFLEGLDSTGLKDAATAELDTFFTALTLEQDATPADLLTSRWAPPLHVGLAAVYGARPGDAALPPGRAGLLTRVGLLASGSDDWHVVGRGLSVLTQVLCRDIPQPTVDVAGALAQAGALRASNLDRIETVTASDSCRGCHSAINPLGGARSDFDAVGRAVTVEKHFAGGVLDYEVPVKALGDLTAALGTPVHTDGSVALSSAIATSQQFQSCFAVQYVRHVLGRRDEGDGCLADDSAQVIASGGSVRDAITAALTSPELLLWKD